MVPLSELQEILVVYFKLSPSAVDVLLSLLLDADADTRRVAEVGPSAGIQLVAVASSELRSADDRAQDVASAATRLLKHPSLRHTDVPGGVVLRLLELALTKSFSGVSASTALLRLVVDVCEQVGPAALRNTTQALTCVSVRGIGFLSIGDDGMFWLLLLDVLQTILKAATAPSRDEDSDDDEIVANVRILFAVHLGVR
jgi:hypothetical protein